MDRFDYDVFVIGGGPGGYEAAIRCRQYGLKTALAEMDKLGGTCLNRGCIPTKALLHSAEMYAQARHFSEIGLSVGDIRADYAAMAARKDRIVTRLRRGVASLEASYGVDVFSERAVLEDAHTIRMGARKIRAKNILLATGSHPSKPPIPGIEGANILTSDDVLALNACPEKIVIVGGGVIGLEFATLFASLGKEVVILEMLDRLLPALDEDVAAVFLRSLRDMKVDVHTASSVVSLQGGNPVVCTFREGGKEKTVCGDICIVCTGREPATTDMGLENTAVRLTHRGFVEVNDCMQTNEPNIYAIGDITGKIQLAHVATAQGMVAAANLAQRTAVMRYDIVPACIYAMPEIAYVGMNSHQSEAAGYRPVAGTFPLAACGRALTMDAPSGIIRLIFDDVSKRLLGAQLISPHATDMIGEICVALKKRLRMDELSDIIHPHPTLCECILEATHAVEGLCCNIAKIS